MQAQGAIEGIGFGLGDYNPGPAYDAQLDELQSNSKLLCIMPTWKGIPSDVCFQRDLAAF